MLSKEKSSVPANITQPPAMFQTWNVYLPISEASPPKRQKNFVLNFVYLKPKCNHFSKTINSKEKEEDIYTF